MTEHPAPETSARPARVVRGAHRAPRRRRGLLTAVLLVALALVATAGTLLVRRDDGAPPATGSDPGPPAEVTGELAGDLAGWIDAELPADAALGAPEQLRTALVDAGVPGGRLTAEDAGALQVVAGEPRGDAVVVAGIPGEDGALISVVDPRPGEPTPEELDRRQRLSEAVLANPVSGATGRAAQVLRAADVDARLLGLVAVLVARLDVGIADFPSAPGQPEEGTPARRVLLDRAGGEELVPGSAAAERVRAFAEAQEPPFAADTVEVTDDGVLLAFDYSSAPDAEVTAATR